MLYIRDQIPQLSNKSFKIFINVANIISVPITIGVIVYVLFGIIVDLFIRVFTISPIVVFSKSSSGVVIKC